MERKPRLLVICGGGGSEALPAVERGWEVVVVDIDPQIESGPNLTVIKADIRNLKPGSLGKFDAMWFAPPCEQFSKAAARLHRFRIDGRRYVPTTPEAAEAIEVVRAGLRFANDAKYWWMENPVGYLCKTDVARLLSYRTIDQCTYGRPQKKPTHLFGYHPKNWTPRDRCTHKEKHVPLRKQKTYLERSAMPRALVDEILKSVENTEMF